MVTPMKRAFDLSGRRNDAAAAVALCLLSALVVTVNLLWVRAHRRGLPFDIDEAGYLQRAIHDADVLRAGGLSGLWHVLRLPDPQAPLLPITAAVVRLATDAGPVGLIASEELFVVVLIVATFVLARQLRAGLVPPLVAAACVAGLPNVVDGGRGFAFALPAAALMTAALAAQLRAGDFGKPRRAIVWGLLLGLATLTRTVMVALLPALVVAALIRLMLSRARPRQWGSFALGLLAAVLVASVWYTATWRLVWDYLTSYGYGAQSVDYGERHPLLSWSRWTVRAVRVYDDVYAPFAIAAFVCAAAAATRLIRKRPTWLGRSREVGAAFFASGWGTVTFVVAADYVVLSTSRNSGSSFELPLLPAVAALLVSGAAAGGRVARVAALAAATGAAAFSFAAANGLFPGPDSAEIHVGPLSAVAYDDRGPLLFYATRYLPANALGITSRLRRWQRANVALTSTLLQEAARHGKPTPVVFFAVQDPFVNTNSVGLIAQERGITLPFGLLVPPRQAGESLAAQLQDPARGVPDVVVIGPPSANLTDKAFAPPDSLATIRRAAGLVGFRKTSDVILPDGRDMELWWRSG
jgi:hypothetical protein